MNHDDDDEEFGCTCEPAAIQPLETHRLIAITTGLAAALFGNVSSFFGYMTAEFQASSDWRRENRERLEAAEELHRLTEGDLR